MAFLKKYWHLTLFIIAVLSLSGYFFYQSQQEPDLNIAGVDVKTPETPTAKAPVGDTSQGGHWHGDEWHTDEHSHPRNPFLLPDHIQNNPQLFEVGPDGFFTIHFPEEIEKKSSQIMDRADKENWSSEVYVEKLAEGLAETLLAEGVSKLAAVQYIRSATVGSAEYLWDLLNTARVENPNDFETLLLWARWNTERKPTETETVYRRLIQMQPDSDRAHFHFGYHILETDPEPKEAIPVLEKAYQLNPNAHATLMHLALAHERLEQYEQALKYYQASWDRTRGRRASFGISYVKSKLAEQQITPQGDR